MNTETIYQFTITPRTQAAASYIATGIGMSGTLGEAIDLAIDLESPIKLTDEAGFTRGRVGPSGNHTLT